MTGQQYHYIRHNVGGILLWILVIGMAGSFYIWGRGRSLDKEKLETALGNMRQLQGDLDRVTNQLDSHIINLGLEARIVVDKQGIIRLCSPTAAEVCGYTTKELLGQSAEVIIPLEMRERHKKSFDKAIADREVVGKVNIVHCMLLKKDGSKRAVEIATRVVDDTTGLRAVITITPVEKIEFVPPVAPNAGATIGQRTDTTVSFPVRNTWPAISR